MAFEDNVLISPPLPADFLGGRAATSSLKKDYEDGGVALNDPSQGHFVQVWSAEIVNYYNIVISNESGFSATYATDTAIITEVALTFDQNMRPTIAYVAGGQAKLIWYDSVVAEEVVTALDADVKFPRVSLDDKRTTQTALSDVILGYIRGDNLYFRMQRDRYQVEYLLATSVIPETNAYLRRIGLNKINRFQFEIFTSDSTEEILASIIAKAADPYTNLPAYQVSGTAAVILTAADNAVWGVNPVITVYALQDPITGNYWVDADGNLLVYTVTTTWD